MKRILLCLLSTLLLTSCATIMHKDTYFVNIQSDLPDAKVRVYDNNYSLPAYIEVVRSKQDLELTLVSNSNQIPFKIKRKRTAAFKYWNLVGLYIAPAFYLTDLQSDRRFHYGKSLWLSSKDSTVTVLNKKDSRYAYDRKSFPKRYKYEVADPPEKTDLGKELLLFTIRTIDRELDKRTGPIKSEPLKQRTNGRRN